MPNHHHYHNGSEHDIDKHPADKHGSSLNVDHVCHPDYDCDNPDPDHADDESGYVLVRRDDFDDLVDDINNIDDITIDDFYGDVRSLVDNARPVDQHDPPADGAADLCALRNNYIDADALLDRHRTKANADTRRDARDALVAALRATGNRG